MAELDEVQFVAFVVEVLEERGCLLADIDFDEKIIHLEGPDKAKQRCAQALRDILG